MKLNVDLVTFIASHIEFAYADLVDEGLSALEELEKLMRGSEDEVSKLQDFLRRVDEAEKDEDDPAYQLACQIKPLAEEFRMKIASMIAHAAGLTE
jgi:hypothetical protein